MGRYFGTDGIRGKADMFTAEFIQKAVWGLKNYTKPKQREQLRVLLGGDTRESTEWILRDLETVLESLGIEYGNVGVLPTPAINYCFYQMGFDFAVDVTASHNTYEDNGLKIFERGKKYGVKLCPEGVRTVEEALDGQSSYATVATELREDLHQEALERYLEHLREYVGQASLKGLKIGLDCANGAVSVVGGRIFEELGAEVTVINSDDRYGTVINRGVGSTHIESLQELVRREGLDFGAAFDGDGDRCLMVDAEGNLVDGDQLLAILTHYLNLPSMVTTVAANQGLMEWAKLHNINLRITDVGDQNVGAEMRKENIKIGGEQSGHVILPGESMGDGMLTALMAAKAVSDTGESLAQLAGAIPRFPQVSLNTPATKEQKAMLLNDEKVAKLLDSANEALASVGGRVLVRASGTEELIRVTLWGKNADEIRTLAEKIVQDLRKLLDKQEI